MVNKEPTFEEGPFFLIEATVYPHIGKQAIIWATDETTARNVFFYKLNLPLAYHSISHIGDLNAVKRDYGLTNAQTSDLHREGYLRL